MTWMGIDNGITGTYCIIDDNDNVFDFGPMPVIKMQDWTKKKKQITRIDYLELQAIINKWRPRHIGIERPLHNGRMFHASISGARALEAVLIACDVLRIEYSILSARDWQKRYLEGSIGNTKARSLFMASLQQPKFEQAFKVHGDADSYFIARYIRDERQNKED